MILRLQISFPLPKAYNSIPSNWRVIRAVLVSFRSAERSLRRELTWERGAGRGNNTLSHCHKKALECSRNLITMVVRGLGSRKGI